MKLLFATTNPHKAREIADILRPVGVSVCGLHEVPRPVGEPVEDGDTLQANARIKAMAYAKAARMPCLADDSGLFVDALGGAPGVNSARYAGEEGTREERDQRNRNKLLSELSKLQGTAPAARLVCTLCLVDRDGNVLFETRGESLSEVIDTPRGEHGFGYDVLLFLPDVQKTVAQLTPEEWNRRSHRGVATRALAQWLKENPHAL